MFLPTAVGLDVLAVVDDNDGLGFADVVVGFDVDVVPVVVFGLTTFVDALLPFGVDVELARAIGFAFAAEAAFVRALW